jgi:hypothetical protein
MANFSFFKYVGRNRIQRGIELCGDGRDAFYLGAGLPEWDNVNQIAIADNAFLMLYGVNHVATHLLERNNNA